MLISVFITLIALSSFLSSSEKTSPTLNALQLKKGSQEAQAQKLGHSIQDTKHDIARAETKLNKKSWQLQHTKTNVARLQDMDIPQARSWQHLYANQGNAALSKRYEEKANKLEREKAYEAAYQQRLQEDTIALKTKINVLKTKEGTLETLNREQKKLLAQTNRGIRFEKQALQKTPQPSFFEQWIKGPYERFAQKIKKPAIQQEPAMATVPAQQPAHTRFYQWRQYWYDRLRKQRPDYFSLSNFKAHYQYTPARSLLCHHYTKSTPTLPV